MWVSSKCVHEKRKVNVPEGLGSIVFVVMSTVPFPYLQRFLPVNFHNIAAVDFLTRFPAL